MVFGFDIHCVKSACIRSYSDPYFPEFGLNTERYSVSLSIQFECGKIRTRKAPNTGICCNLFPFFFPYLQMLAIDKIAQDFVNRFQKKLLFKGFLHGNNSKRFHKFPMKTRLEEQLCIYDPVKHL